MICYSHDSHIHVPWSLVMMYKLIILYFLQSQLFCTLFRITYKIKTEIGVFCLFFKRNTSFWFTLIEHLALHCSANMVGVYSVVLAMTSSHHNSISKIGNSRVIPVFLILVQFSTTGSINSGF